MRYRRLGLESQLAENGFRNRTWQYMDQVAAGKLARVDLAHGLHDHRIDVSNGRKQATAHGKMLKGLEAGRVGGDIVNVVLLSEPAGVNRFDR